MRHQSFDPAQLKAPAGVFALLLAIFATELAVMELLPPLFSRLGTLFGALLDAGIVAAIITFLIWFIVSWGAGEDFTPGDSLPAAQLAKVSACVFLIEYLVMLLLPVLLPLADNRTRSLTDAFLTSVCSGFPLWWFLFRQKMRRHRVPLLDTPLLIYVLLLCTIFLADLLQELFLPWAAEESLASGKIIDAFVTNLLCAPLLWILVVRPLKRAARSEKTRVLAVHAQVIDAIVAIDPQGVIRSFNPAAERIFGYGAGDMIGNSAAQLLDDGEQGLAALIAGAAPLPGEPTAPPFGEISCRRRDGLPLIMGVSISQVLLEQRPELLLIMRDITNRRRMERALQESETRFREIFHQSEDAILFFKPGGCFILDANAKAESIFGYSRQQLQEGGLELICEPADLPKVARAISGIGEGSNAQQDFLCRRRDLAQIVVSLRGKVMLLQGAPITYCSFRDVTERIRMEEQTRDIQARLIQANKMTSLGLLVSGVSHEINNPNNFIMANAELLAKITEDSLKVLKEYSQEHREDGEFYIAGIPFPELAEHARRLLNGISEGARRVNDIVDNLKGFARQERNQAKRDVDVNQVARSAVTLMHHELIKFTEHFHLELADTVPPVKGHGQQLGQVIINLLMNACQALPGKQSGIWLTTGFDAEQRVVTISVRDEGCGMSREESHRIMEPFFTTRIDSGGTGLGLSISESIVKEHGGRLEFSSEPGEGTTFAVRIPAAQ